MKIQTVYRMVCKLCKSDISHLLSPGDTPNVCDACCKDHPCELCHKPYSDGPLTGCERWICDACLGPCQIDHVENCPACLDVPIILPAEMVPMIQNILNNRSN